MDLEKAAELAKTFDSTGIGRLCAIAATLIEIGLESRGIEVSTPEIPETEEDPWYSTQKAANLPPVARVALNNNTSA